MALKAAQEELDVLTQSLNKLRTKLKEVEDKIIDLEHRYNDSVAKKEELAAKARRDRNLGEQLGGYL